MDGQTAVLIGTRQCCRRLEQQLNLMARRPATVGWVVLDRDDPDPPGDGDEPILGDLVALESVIARTQPSIAIVNFPAVMAELITSIRTRLRRLGVPDRFMPTLEDQVAGVGPRTHLEIDHAALLNRSARHFEETAVRELVAGRRVLITGAGGSIGSELARQVSRFSPDELLLVERSENALFEVDRQIAQFDPDLPRRAILHDIVDAEATAEILQLERPDIVFHAAAHKHVPMMEDHPGAALDNNLFGTKSIADAAAEAGCDRFVMISTDKAVNPVSIMGATKRLAELYVQHMNRTTETGFSMVRFGNVLGSSGSVLDVWSRQLADGGPVTVTDPEMTRYFMTMPEAASLVIQAGAIYDPHCPAGEVFLLDMGEPVRIVDLARRFIEQHGLQPILPGERTSVDDPGCVNVLYTGARPGEKLFEELAFDSEAMQPTRHPDIMIWQLESPEPDQIEAMLDRLEPLRTSRQVELVAGAIRDVLPEMRSAACAA